MSVSIRDRLACVRLVGRASFASSVDFKKLLEHLRQDGCTQIVLDLGECSMMDSTFLGVLAHLGGNRDGAQSVNGQCPIKLFHPSERVVEMLENLDVLKLFTIVDDPPKCGTFKRVDDCNASRVELNRTCLEAHQTLMDTNTENERRFRDATEFFRKNLENGGGKE